eukprot:3236752-Prymnesium_polylepis.1
MGERLSVSRPGPRVHAHRQPRMRRSPREPCLKLGFRPSGALTSVSMHHAPCSMHHGVAWGADCAGEVEFHPFPAVVEYTQLGSHASVREPPTAVKNHPM